MVLSMLYTLVMLGSPTHFLGPDWTITGALPNPVDWGLSARRSGGEGQTREGRNLEVSWKIYVSVIHPVLSSGWFLALWRMALGLPGLAGHSSEDDAGSTFPFPHLQPMSTWDLLADVAAVQTKFSLTATGSICTVKRPEEMKEAADRAGV